jgi:hypothetical protein
MFPKLLRGERIDRVARRIEMAAVITRAAARVNGRAGTLIFGITPS